VEGLKHCIELSRAELNECGQQSPKPYERIVRASAHCLAQPIKTVGDGRRQADRMISRHFRTTEVASLVIRRERLATDWQPWAKSRMAVGTPTNGDLAPDAIPTD